ncbi:PREDICTED: uncharacterized protein LOC109476140 [Branchiostoma belcheri]|uniref:Uncharacterized protein LOC109476140 n=1 Tax=Branchiostoma belcheri TaxID=7741 RepID=A0A6P4YT42_BRABE|nr:PREDICTED: uncharacterized protein LOC109476140 [Branchiostoma belcheri]
MAEWVAHAIRTQTAADCSELLRVCAEMSDHLPITCCSLAHFLSMTKSPTHLHQFVTLLMQRQLEGESDNSNHRFLVVNTIAESKQLDALSSLTQTLFPDKTLDLSAIPEISLHGLHCLTQLIRNTTLIQRVKLPENMTFKHVAKQYPFGSKRSSSTNHTNQIRYLSYLPLFECLSSTCMSLDSLLPRLMFFVKKDKKIKVEIMQQYLLFNQSLEKLKVKSDKFTSGTLGNLSKSLLFTPNITDIAIAFNEVNNDDMKQAMIVLSCLHNLKHAELTEYSSVSCLSGRSETLTLQCKTRPDVWPSVFSFLPFDIQELVLYGRQKEEDNNGAWCERSSLLVLPTAAVAELASSFRHLECLVKLNLKCLKVSSSEWLKLCQGLSLLCPGTSSAEGDEVSRFPPLKMLGFTYCNLTSDDILSLTEQLPTLQNLEEIDLSHNDISDEAVPGLAEGLSSSQNMKKVNLSHNKLSGRGDFLPPLPNLEEIDLSHNAISDEAVPDLARGLSSCENLKKVYLESHRISNKGALLLLLQGQCKRLQLKIRENNISGDLVSLICNRKNASQVTKLDLTSADYPWSNVAPLRTSDVPLLLQFLSQLPNLQELALCVSCQGEEEAIHINQLYGVQHLLKKLKLKGWSLDNIISVSTQMFQHFHMLEEIDLSQNAISDEAVSGLAQGLASCQNLKMVDLSYNKLSDVGELMKAFINLPFLTHVDMYHNSISDKSLPTIAARLKVSRNVEEVRLYDNRFSAEGVRDFIRSMKGKAYRLFSDDLLYDGSQADMSESVESGGEGAQREEQQWERLRVETELIKVKFRQLAVCITHKGQVVNS